MMCRIAVLISNKGTGTNLQAIIDGVESKKINAEIVAVVSDTPQAPGLQRARKHKLPIKIAPKKADLLPLLKKLNPDYICLAGWKQIILDEVIEAFPNRILNTHPGLIPDTMDGVVKNPDGTDGLWNKGRMTEKAMRNFLDNQATYAGSTIHLLSLEFDFGPVLGRVFEKIKPGDTVDSLYTRLKVKENKLYVNVLSKLCNDYSNNLYKTILIVGSGGREHALVEKYSRSKLVKKVFVAPGNDLMSYKNKKIIIVSDIAVLEFEKLLGLIKKEKINLVDVAQDDPLAAGLVDVLEVEGMKVFGPSQSAAEIEWNKIWSRNFMEKYRLPVPGFMYFSNTGEAIKYVEALPEQVLYIKAAGLAAGKGAIRAENKGKAREAILSMKQFGKSGEKFVIEEAMTGEEFSLFVLCDGRNYQVISFAQDHKTVYEKDQGPNTGGMGCVAPTSLIDKKLIIKVKRKIIEPFMVGMRKEGRPYSGVLYVGGMLTKEGVKIVEFNARWGDPEAEVILPAIKTDYLKIVEKIIQGRLNEINIKVDDKVRVSIAGCAKGYPGDYSSVKGKEIFGLDQAMKLPAVTIYGAGIKIKNDKFYVNGGRVFHLVAEGKNIMEAREKAYQAMALIDIEGDNLHYRTDIGWRDVERLISKRKSQNSKLKLKSQNY